MARPLSIAIIGAGMGGLATAAALRRVGVDVTVYEQATQFARIGAGIQIGCNAMKVLRGLGLEARLRAQSFYPRSWNNRDWRTGEIKFDMIFGESAERKFGAPYLLAHRGDLHAALASAVPDQCVRLNHKLVGLEESGEGVRLAFANGASVTADAVIAHLTANAAAASNAAAPSRPCDRPSPGMSTVGARIAPAHAPIVFALYSAAVAAPAASRSTITSRPINGNVAPMAIVAGSTASTAAPTFQA